MQVNLLVGRQVGSFFDGAVAWLSYADRLYQLPLGVVGIAIGVVLLPDLSRRLKAGDDQGGRDALNRATEFTLALTLPAAVALMVIPVPIVAVLFQRGAFGAADTLPTALAVAVYGAGLPAFVLQKVDLAALLRPRGHPHAVPLRRARDGGERRRRARPRPFIGFVAAALGTTVAGWVMLFQLWRGTRRMDRAAEVDARLRRAVPRIAAACADHGGSALRRRAGAARARSPTPRAATSRWRSWSRSAWRPTSPPPSRPARCARPTSARRCAAAARPRTASRGLHSGDR